uniref:Uncharacterized protein n=1 Tax=Ditylenchus dipsaci TaxID=166011 RepID=A0A915CMS9_9BILA
MKKSTLFLFLIIVFYSNFLQAVETPEYSQNSVNTPINIVDGPGLKESDDFWDFNNNIFDVFTKDSEIPGVSTAHSFEDSNVALVARPEPANKRKEPERLSIPKLSISQAEGVYHVSNIADHNSSLLPSQPHSSSDNLQPRHQSLSTTTSQQRKSQKIQAQGVACTDSSNTQATVVLSNQTITFIRNQHEKLVQNGPLPQSALGVLDLLYYTPAHLWR